jgi:GGDEF domain-containing protein
VLDDSTAHPLLAFALGVIEATAGIAFFEMYLHHRAVSRDDGSLDVDATQRFDALTKLPDRTTLAAQAQIDIIEAQRRSTPLAVLVLNVDRLKPIND